MREQRPTKDAEVYDSALVYLSSSSSIQMSNTIYANQESGSHSLHHKL